MPRHAGLMLLLMACGFLVVGQLYVTIPLVGDIASRFAVDPGRAALVGSAFGIAYAAGFLIFGPLSDRYGRRAVLIAGLAATGVTTALVGLASTFAVLLLTRALQGLAASAFPPAALSLVAESLPPAQRPLGVSLMSFAFLGAAPLAQFFAAQSGAGLPAIMLELAPLYLAGATGLFFVARPDLIAAPRDGAVVSGAIASLSRDRGILAAWAAAATVLFGFVSFHAGVQALGGDVRVDLQSLRLIGLPPLALTFAAAPLTRRFDAPTTARAGLLLAALSLGLGISGTPNVLLLACILLSAGVALAVPGLIATVAGRATNANRGLALAVYSFTLFIGASLAPPVAQALAAIGTIPLFLLPVALLLAAAFAVGIRSPTPANP
ncbi:MFS transporter [Rhodopseudomonas sp. HC1]|uniref:MFS transporter n=1 Tax=Rhodopseudomonas infernalis TaxID=2897386 RepID=UPI001EE9874C|nr:MFS transporter [Rhodopseudomonas infernalis]MCG6207464.1 MFS transporter [Rhodopseudomonas infernalis]